MAWQPPAWAALSGQGPKPEGRAPVLRHEGLTATARANHQGKSNVLLCPQATGRVVAGPSNVARNWAVLLHYYHREARVNWRANIERWLRFVAGPGPVPNRVHWR